MVSFAIIISVRYAIMMMFWTDVKTRTPGPPMGTNIGMRGQTAWQRGRKLDGFM